MYPDPHPALDDAQRRYIQRSGERIDQAVIQRLNGWLHAGATVEEAVKTVFAFFAREIDWEKERREFAEWIAKRRCGAICATVVISMSARN